MVLKTNYGGPGFAPIRDFSLQIEYQTGAHKGLYYTVLVARCLQLIGSVSDMYVAMFCIDPTVVNDF